MSEEDRTIFDDMFDVIIRIEHEIWDLDRKVDRILKSVDMTAQEPDSPQPAVQASEIQESQ